MRVLVEGCKADGQGRTLTMWAQKKNRQPYSEGMASGGTDRAFLTTTSGRHPRRES